MEGRLSNQDMAFDAHPEDDGEERESASPAFYLRQADADPAEVLAEVQWDERRQALLASAIAELDERSRDILASRWLNEEKLTLHDLAERYQVSAERIRQLESGAMKKLKKALLEDA
jgi:RNA polymerase sigma-32 factor